MKALNPALAGGMAGDYLGLRLRFARERKGLTIAKAAPMLGLSAGHLGRIKRGGVTMVNEPAVLQRASVAYGVSAVWLYAGASAGQRFVPDGYSTGAAA